jgi:Fe-S oxidoreductase
LNEYPDLGGTYEVVHHTDYILGLLAEKRLEPKHSVKAKVAYHDSCYLGRYNDVYEQPREILRRIPGVQLVEPETHHHKGLCCGAGGAQMFMEEQNKDRVNVKRTRQLLATQADVISSACPFCMTMLSDGLKNEDREADVRQLDVIELLAKACLDPAPPSPAAA